LLVCSLIAAAAATLATQTPTEADSATLAAFLSRGVGPRTPYRAERRLLAGGVGKTAWLEATTSFDAVTGFVYTITREEGSGLVRSRVLRPALKAEAEATAGDPARTAFTTTNYDISVAGDAGEGLVKLRLKPKRKDQLLVDGLVVVTRDSAQLVRMEGRLSKNPSFWTRRVDIIRNYEVIQGVHLVAQIDSRADLRLFGSSFFCMEIRYDIVAGEPVDESRRPWTSCGRKQ
jgi:hypothetical protein